MAEPRPPAGLVGWLLPALSPSCQTGPCLGGAGTRPLRPVLTQGPGPAWEPRGPGRRPPFGLTPGLVLGPRGVQPGAGEGPEWTGRAPPAYPAAAHEHGPEPGVAGETRGSTPCPTETPLFLAPSDSDKVRAAGSCSADNRRSHGLQRRPPPPALPGPWEGGTGLAGSGASRGPGPAPRSRGARVPPGAQQGLGRHPTPPSAVGTTQPLPQTHPWVPECRGWGARDATSGRGLRALAPPASKEVTGQRSRNQRPRLPATDDARRREEWDRGSLAAASTLSTGRAHPQAAPSTSSHLASEWLLVGGTVPAPKCRLPTAGRARCPQSGPGPRAYLVFHAVQAGADGVAAPVLALFWGQNIVSRTCVLGGRPGTPTVWGERD